MHKDPPMLGLFIIPNENNMHKKRRGRGVQLTVTRFHQAQEVAKGMEEMGGRQMNGLDHVRGMMTSPPNRLGRCENAPPTV